MAAVRGGVRKVTDKITGRRNDAIIQNF